MLEIMKYIQPSSDNLSSYGSKIAKCYLSTCSEIDVALKSLCQQAEFELEKPLNNINDARSMVQHHFEREFGSSIVRVRQSELAFCPWNSWWDNDGRPTEINPEWWTSYNRVKHHRLERYSEANLGNALNALAALFVVDSLLFRVEYDRFGLPDVPRFLASPKSLYFDRGGIQIGSDDYIYVKGTTVCAGQGFHVDLPLQIDQ